MSASEATYLLLGLLDEIRAEIEAATGAMLTPQGFIFVSSPNSVTPYHFDPEHNILLQIRGSKVMTQFPAGDTRFVPDEAHETYHSGGPRELKWDDGFLAHGTQFPLSPGEALFVPVMAPHFVQNGPAPSVSLSITWRSEWSYRESEAHAANAALLVTRMLGLKNPEDFSAAGSDQAAPAWGAVRYTDSQGGIWRKLSVRDLLADNDFMNIGV